MHLVVVCKVRYRSGSLPITSDHASTRLVAECEAGGTLERACCLLHFQILRIVAEASHSRAVFGSRVWCTRMIHAIRDAGAILGCEEGPRYMASVMARSSATMSLYPPSAQGGIKGPCSMDIWPDRGISRSLLLSHQCKRQFVSAAGGCQSVQSSLMLQPASMIGIIALLGNRCQWACSGLLNGMARGTPNQSP